MILTKELIEGTGMPCKEYEETRQMTYSPRFLTGKVPVFNSKRLLLFIYLTL